jgi:hypothetical protein
MADYNYVAESACTRAMSGDGCHSWRLQRAGLLKREIATAAQRFVGLLWLLGTCSAASLPGPWDLSQLSHAPHTIDAVAPQEAGMKAFFFEGLPWHGKPTRIFAWYGAPAHKVEERVPAIVLVHGGKGTAFADWVKLWNDRGYAAIAIDTCGALPSRGFGEPSGVERRPRHNFAGPPCWDSSFEQVDWPVQDQWTFHAVADIILANSLLRSFPKVDPKRIGITGISWGGYLTAIAASVDPRFCFAVPVYGCGFLGKDSVWTADFKKMGEVDARKWLELWDPSVYLHRAKMPFLWVSGTNDFAYPLDSLQESYLLPLGPRTLSIRMRMPHGHGGPGERPEEIHAFADQITRSGKPLADIRAQGVKGRNAWVRYESLVPIKRAELTYTTDGGVWQDRRWLAIPAEIDDRRYEARASLPAGVTVYYFNLIDERGLLISSEHRNIDPSGVHLSPP